MTGRPISPIWSEDNLDRMRTWLIQGKNYREIAELIPGASRSAVAGKIKRLGWNHLQPKRPPQPKQSGWKRWRKQIKGEIARPFLNIPLIELTSDTCRWPSEQRREDGSHGFCGQPKLSVEESFTTPYCAYHLKMGVVYIRGKSSDIVRVLQKEGVPR